MFTTKKEKKKKSVKDKAKRILFGFGKKKDDTSSSSDSMSSDDSSSDSDDAGNLHYQDGHTIDYHDYEYCPERGMDFVPNAEDEQNLAFRKMDFMLTEILADMGIKKVSREAAGDFLLAVAMLWLRMLIHFIGQYVLLKSMDCPVTSIVVELFRVKIEYGYWNIAQEVGVVFIGPLSCTIIFSFMIGVIKISQNKILCFPRSLSKAFAWFGFFTIFDFFLVAIIDFTEQDPNGDLFKLYNYFEKAGSSGFIGIFLTFIIQFFILIINIFLFYHHIVFVHHDSKIKDIYLRITGKGRNYFIPEDNELSYRNLKHQYIEGELNQNRVICNLFQVWNSTEKKEQACKLIHFYQFVSEKSLRSGKSYISNIYG